MTAKKLIFFALSEYLISQSLDIMISNMWNNVKKIQIKKCIGVYYAQTGRYLILGYSDHDKWLISNSVD